jgi:hypothetical protein
MLGRGIQRNYRFFGIWFGAYLSLLLANGLHEKASLVKANVMTKAPTIQDETPLPRFHSHSL